MEPLLASATVCSVCGEPLSAKGGCVACLLRAGLDEDVPEDTSPPPLLVFGDFEIERRGDGSFWELGHGAMGITYRALDKVLHRTVALKVIEVSASAGDSHAVRERFLREARSAAALRHPNVAGVFQFGASPNVDRCYYAMELVEGETLEARLRRDGPLKVGLALEIAIQVSRALMAAASHGLIHRDLKPGNIMLTSGDVATAGLEVKVIDFGLAKATADSAGEMDITHGGFVGTPTFASPEQFSSGPIDARSDIYSLGVTLWYALSGLVPCAGNTIEEVRHFQIRAELPVKQLVARKVPAPVIKLLRRILAVDPARRPASARELMEALESCRAKLAHRSGIRSFRKRAALIAVVAIAATALFTLRLNRQKTTSAAVSTTGSPPTTLIPLPEKSIAVLPFENLSAEKNDAFFADGIQDDVLTSLATIKELKVISHTSVMAYRDAGARNTRQIGHTLGVANVLEGSVRRVGDRVAVNVQLIDTRTDRHLWAKHYDRTLTDSLGLQGELANEIATALRATLSREEKVRIEIRPTSSVPAYEAYLRGLAYTLKTSNTPANALGAQRYLREAVRLDPKFALSWALLSFVEARSYLTLSLQPTVALREEIRQAAETALTLQPNLGEALHARGYYHYACLKDYDTAVRYFEQARQLLPNSSRILESLAYVARRRGDWDRSESYFNEAERLDPRNVFLLTQHGLSYIALRRFPEALRKFDQVLDITPDDLDTLAQEASIAEAEGDLPRASALLAPLHPAADDPQALEIQVYQAILERRPAQIVPRLKEILAKPDPALGFYNGELRFWLGWAQEVAGDHAAAQESWRQARSELEAFLKEQPDNFQLIGDLALVNMGLGDKAGALTMAERAIAMIPIEKDALNGPLPIEILARVAAQIGEPDRAIATLQKLLSIPYAGPLAEENMPLTPALLRLDPMFDPLRNDQRFEKLVTDLTPKPSRR
jgi:serine/threonine protein kinase/tetratricopeptide (TPR) repeat protein